MIHASSDQVHFQRKFKQEEVLKTFLGAVFIVFVEEKVLGRLWAEVDDVDKNPFA